MGVFERAVKKAKSLAEDEIAEQEKIAQKDNFKAEAKALEDLLELYMKSNPNYDKKEEVKEPEPKVDLNASIEHAFYLFAQVQLLSSRPNAHAAL